MTHHNSVTVVLVICSSSSSGFSANFNQLKALGPIGLLFRSTAAAALPFRLGDPALCGSHLLVLKFADDTKLFGTVNNDIDRRSIQNDLYRLTDWSEKWQMHSILPNVKLCIWAEETVSFSTL